MCVSNNIDSIEDLIGRSILSINGLKKDSKSVTIVFKNGAFQIREDEEKKSSASLKNYQTIDDLCEALILDASLRTTKKPKASGKGEAKTTICLETSRGDINMRWMSISDEPLADAPKLEWVDEFNLS